MTAIYPGRADVFRPDAEAHGETSQGALRRVWLRRPLPARPRPARRHPRASRTGRLDLPRQCRPDQRADYVLANFEPFRGSKPDNGTAFEVGYARPWQAGICLPQRCGAYTERLARLAPGMARRAPREDRDGWQLEGFGRH